MFKFLLKRTLYCYNFSKKPDKKDELEEMHEQLKLDNIDELWSVFGAAVKVMRLLLLRSSLADIIHANIVMESNPDTTRRLRARADSLHHTLVPAAGASLINHEN